MTRHEYADKLLEIARKRAALETEVTKVQAAYITANSEFEVGDRATIVSERQNRIVQVIGHRIERGDVIPRLRKVKKNGEVGEVSDHVYPGEEIFKITK